MHHASTIVLLTIQVLIMVAIRVCQYQALHSGVAVDYVWYLLYYLVLALCKIFLVTPLG